MTISSNESQIQQNDPFASLYPHQFVLLTTFRQSGEGVPTTVWFAQDDAGHIYVTTQDRTGKIKRIGRNGEVRMTPSDARGTIVDGQQAIAGYARQVLPAEYKQAEAALVRKYGEQYAAVVARSGESGQASRTFIEISPKGATL